MSDLMAVLNVVNMTALVFVVNVVPNIDVILFIHYSTTLLDLLHYKLFVEERAKLCNIRKVKSISTVQP